LRASYGLDKPLPVQFFYWLKELAHGNLGFSFANRQPVLPLVLSRYANTLVLAVCAMVFAAVEPITFKEVAKALASRFSKRVTLTASPMVWAASG